MRRTEPLIPILLSLMLLLVGSPSPSTAWIPTNSQPTELEFVFIPDVAIYMPPQTTPTLVRGHGLMTLSFESTNDPDILAVHLRDIRVKLAPFTLPIDLDRDGEVESVEVTNVTIDRQFFDLEACTGSLNTESGDFELMFAYVIGPKNLPLMERMAGIEMRLTVHDRGTMDIREGTFEIHSPVLIEINDGPLAGAQIRGGGTGVISSPQSSIEMNVVIATPGVTGCGKVKQHSVLICPRDRVLLCWTSSDDVASVDITPGPKGQPSTGVHLTTPVLPAPPSPREVVYRAETKGGHSSAQDTIVVQFYRNGDPLGPYSAEAAGTSWVIEIPPASTSGKIQVQEVQLVRGGSCVKWDKLFVEHFPPPPPAGPGGGPDFGRSIDGTAPIMVSTPFSAAGKWQFTAQLDPPKTTPVPVRGEPVCFQIRGQCIP